MGCGVGILRVLLVIINIFFGLLAVAFLAVGIILKVGIDAIKDGGQDVLDSLPSLAEGVNIADAESEPDGGATLDIDELLTPIAIAFIVFGAVLLLICIFACIGACCGQRVCMIIYAVVLILIFLTQLILVILFFTGTLSDDIKSQLNDTIVDEYRGIDSWDHWSVSWNFFMAEYECCGLDSYEDFSYAKHWKRTRKLTDSSISKLTTPVTCCMLDGTFPGVTVHDDSCAITPTDSNSNYNTGCWGKVQDDLEEYRMPAIGACIGVLAFEALVIIASLVVYNSMRKKRNQLV